MALYEAPESNVHIEEDGRTVKRVSEGTCSLLDSDGLRKTCVYTAEPLGVDGIALRMDSVLQDTVMFNINITLVLNRATTLQIPILHVYFNIWIEFKAHMCLFICVYIYYSCW